MMDIFADWGNRNREKCGILSPLQRLRQVFCSGRVFATVIVELKGTVTMSHRRNTYWNKIFGNVFGLSIIHPAREHRVLIPAKHANSVPKKDTQHQKIMGNSILIIDDEPDICRLLQLNLSKYGYKVKYVHALSEGWQFLRSHPTDVLFLDIHLPDGSGLEALPQIKKLYPALQVITISAYDNGLEKEKALTAGAAHFLPKPFNVGKLQEIITDVKVSD